MAKIIAVCNQKGGVGKTSVTHNFASELAKRGNQVLAVDYDSQANLTLSCGIEDFDELDTTLADTMTSIIKGDSRVPALPIINYRENFDFVPTNTDLAGVNIDLYQAMSREWVLDMTLTPVKDKYDYILIDCAPSLSFDLINALTAANEVLIVTNPAKFSAKGSHQLMRSILKTKKLLNPALVVAGVVFNRVDKRTNIAKGFITVMNEEWQAPIQLDDVRVQIGVFDTYIPSSVKIEESQTMGVPIYEYDPRNKTATAFNELVDEYLRKEV